MHRLPNSSEALNEKYPGQSVRPAHVRRHGAGGADYHRGELPGVEGINRCGGKKERSLWRDRLGHLGPGFDRLEGYVFYATIYGRSPELIDGDIPFGGSSDYPSDELDGYFRKIAWQAVVNNPLSGVIDRNHNGKETMSNKRVVGQESGFSNQDTPSENEKVPRNDSAIDDVEAGRVETALASWWGFDPEDATKSMQSAMGSRAGRIVVDNMGRPWIVTTIELPSDKEIIFEPGVVVEAKRGAFLGKGDCLFQARGRKNLMIRGSDATFRMHKSDYHKAPYELAEWRDALSIRGCENVMIEGLTLSESGGDGIYLGVGSDGGTNRNVVIREVVCDGNNRQGVSVITAENLLVENCIFRNTHGQRASRASILSRIILRSGFVNCLLRNCHSENNAGHAYHIYLGHMNEQSPPISIRFENCTSKGGQRYSTYVGIANRYGRRTVRGKIEYVGCRFDADALGGVYIRGNEADGCRVRFERCEIIRRDETVTHIAPITIEAPRRLDLDVGNIEISDCMIRDTLVRQPLALIASPMTGVRNLSGSLKVDALDGEHFYTLDAAQLDEWFPSQGLVAGIPRMTFDWKNTKLVASDISATERGKTFRLRGEAMLLVWGEAGHPVEFVANMEPVGRSTPSAGAMNVTTPDGETTKLNPKTQDKHSHTF